MSARSRVLLCAVGVLACGSAVQGTPIAITNYSFESDPADTSPGSYYGGGPPTTDWSIDQGSFAGVGPNLQQPGVAEDQNQFYVSTVYGGGISNFVTQNLTYTGSLGTFAADTIYSLTVAVAHSPNTNTNGDNGVAGVELLANSVATGTSATITIDALIALSADASTSANWTDITTIVNTATDPGIVGQAIGITLTNNVIDPNASWGNEYFDNVRLDATPVPEPATASLALLGLTATTLRRRRRTA
jgi:hypothetical protein